MPEDGDTKKARTEQTEALLGLSVVKASGDLVGKFRISRDALVDELRVEIHKAGGPPALFQQLLCGHEELKDGEPLGAHCHEGDTLQLLLCLPRNSAAEDIAVDWMEIQHTDQLLEELTIRDTQAKFETVMPKQRVAAVGLEANTGLVVLLGTGLKEVPDDELVEGKGKGKGGKDGKGKGGKDGTEYYNFVPPQMLVVPPAAPPFDVPLTLDHPLRRAVEFQVVECRQGYPLPSLGICVAMVREYPWDASCRMFLVAFELVPELLVDTVVPSCADCQSFCLDGQEVLWIDRDDREVLRCKRADVRKGSSSELFQLEGTTRVTSIATASDKILLTRAKSHSVEVFDSGGNWLMRLGDHTRGCQDGEAAQVRFWFPVWSERLVDGPYGFTHKDSSPLIMGPAGSIFVYSGGVLMKISDDLSSAKKVMSVREELWLTERDEGTPQFPEVCSVIGVHDGYLYRVLIRTDWREEVILRRLKCEDSLRQPRSVLRERAPMMWPAITDGRILVDDTFGYGLSHPNVKPHYYDEKSRDTWDGNCRWLGEPWLWDECGRPPNAKDLHMDGNGRLFFPGEREGEDRPRCKESRRIFSD